MNRDIELNHLKYFYYTVLEGGVTPAANKLFVQQSVVSKMLKNLENSLGEALFWKKGRTKELTDYGQLIFRHCQNIFTEIDKIKNDPLAPKEVAGLTTIGGSESILNYVFPKILKKAKSLYPNLNYNTYLSTQAHTLKMISEEKIELGLLFYAPFIPKELEIIEKIPFTFKLVVRSDIAKNKQILKSFIGSREIEDTSSHHFPTIDFLKLKGIQSEIEYSTNSTTLQKSLVLEGLGVSILPEFIVKKELKSKKLQELFPQKKFYWDLLVIKKKSKTLGPGSEFLIKELKENIRSKK